MTPDAEICFDIKNLKKCKNFSMDNYAASLTYVCFIAAKGLIRDLSTKSSNIAFEVSLASNDGGNLAFFHIRVPRLPPSF